MLGPRLSRLAACLITSSLAAGPLACKKEDETPAEAEQAAEDNAADEKTSPSDAPKTTADDTAPTPASGSAGAGAGWWDDAAPSYAEELQTLLDLVPAQPDLVVVVRDPDALLAVGEALLRAARSAATIIVGFDETKDAEQEVQHRLDMLTGLRASLKGEGYDLGRGIVMGRADGKTYLLHAGTDPKALPELLARVAPTAKTQYECAAAAAVEGQTREWIACTPKGEDPSSYAPGRQGAKLRTGLAEQLGGLDLDRPNLLSWHPAEAIGAAAVHTPAGGLHIVVDGKNPSLAQTIQALSPGAAPSLHVRPPRGGFYWLRVDPKQFEGQIASSPAPLQTTLRNATGEVYLGRLDGIPGYVLMAGMTDTAPAAGLVAMASLGFEQVPKELEDGTKLQLALETVKLGEREVQAVHATFEPSPAMAAGLKEADLAPEAWAFASGHYAAVVLGAGREAVETIAQFEPPSTPIAVKELPPALGRGLTEGKVGMATYVALDALQNPGTLAVLQAQLAGALPPGESKLSAEQAIELVRSVLSPMSDLSVWIGEDENIHVGISLFADPRTEEGKAALAVLEDIDEGGDAKALYADLKGRFASSPRAAAYELRGGEPHPESAFILGVLAGISVPAFTKYIERSKAAAPGSPVP